MDCYFRQYWKDERLKFPPLDLSAHTSQIDQLSLNVAMLEMIWKVGGTAAMVVLKTVSKQNQLSDKYNTNNFGIN